MLRFCLMLLLSAAFATAPQLGLADDSHDHDSERVRGSTTGGFTQFDFLRDIDGSLLFNVTIEGTFTLQIDGEEHNGTYKYPHLLQIPPGEVGLGTIAGVVFWTFDNGLTCIGEIGGPIGPNGGQSRARLRCADGTILVLHIEDEEVIPGVQVTSSVRGRLVY